MCVLAQMHNGGMPRCQAGGACAPTRAALGWPDYLPCVDPSKVSAWRLHGPFCHPR